MTTTRDGTRRRRYCGVGRLATPAMALVIALTQDVAVAGEQGRSQQAAPGGGGTLVVRRGQQTGTFASTAEFDDRWLRTVRVAEATRRGRGFYGGVPTATTGSLDWSFQNGDAAVGLTHIRNLAVVVDLEIQGSGRDAHEAFELFRGLVMRTVAGLVGAPEVADGDWDVAIWSGMLIVGGLSAPIMSPPPEVVWSWALIEAACGSLALPLDDAERAVERSWKMHVSKPRGVTLALSTRDVVDAHLGARKECSARLGYGEVVTYGP